MSPTMLARSAAKKIIHRKGYILNTSSIGPDDSCLHSTLIRKERASSAQNDLTKKLFHIEEREVHPASTRLGAPLSFLFLLASLRAMIYLERLDTLFLPRGASALASKPSL